MLRLTLTATISITAGVSPSIVAVAAAEDRPKVEFVEVDDKRCLQSIVSAGPVELADYREAELRWLASHRPSASAPRWKTVSETAYLDGVVGPNATVCFDINFTGTQPRSSIDAGSPPSPASPYYDLIGIGWSEKADDGPRIVWHPSMPGIEPSESMRIFKHLEGPDINECMVSIIESRPEVRAELAKMGADTACGGTPDAIARARALWTSYGFADALAEVARLGRRGEAVSKFLANCRAAREAAKPSSPVSPQR